MAGNKYQKDKGHGSQQGRVKANQKHKNKWRHSRANKRINGDTVEHVREYIHLGHMIADIGSVRWQLIEKWKEPNVHSAK